MDLSVASVNSALQRARATIEQQVGVPSRIAADPGERELLHRYVDAFEHDDVEALVSLLREDALMRMPPQRSLTGAVEIARFLRQVAGGGDLSRMQLTPTWANGRPAVAIHRRTEDRGLIPHGISVLEIEDGQIVRIDSFIDAALLPRFGFPPNARSVRSP